ncbi:MAG: succinylglutamate desuccinylase/aspartoacylase family protein [Caldilineaceae bacterium]|nr:succinylglutamate desuccinylase/aspartoacylase family protein [Caldilineaceae bacterium]
MHIDEFEIAKLPRSQKAYEMYDVAARPDGGMWRVPVLTITSAQEGPTFVVIAGIHGDEYEGPETIANVYQQLTPDQLKQGNLVMVPFFNIPAWEAGTRTSPIDGLNLARVMPGDPNGSISYRLGYYVTHKFIDPSDMFLDIHSGGVALNICTSIYYYATDNEIGRKTKAAAEAFAAPAVIGSINPQNAVYGCSFRTCWDRNKAGMFTEAHGAGRTLPQEIECFTAGVFNVLKHMEMMEGEPDTHRTTHHLVGDKKGGGSFNASVAGYFKPAVRMMDQVTTGQRLGAILDFSGAVLEEYVSGRDGYVTNLRATPRTSVGDNVIGITGGERLR